ncbi:tryptophan synthase subunit alpha [Sphingomicrobium lutaoense]|uniref:Tryptophan synthase alpha chain n=1 Tax=Sphingomicrobium lutaoense TaxID=515949 RepID=A0A839Z4J1_9SPHN|nr:tryptophan synthase subunit alpha [Sphingomicrobium lutaoense]MBB3764773.1 tryptophan synthase alpha chain [Sphingomicrobium lutaoense]
MSHRYDAMFARAEAQGETALGGFLMLGDPNPEHCERLIDALVEGGVDMLELGIPFSDPVADGPEIQAAAKRALDAGFRPADAFHLIARIRERHPDIPIGLLTYANLLAARGVVRFCEDLAAAGADSLLVADLPTLEASDYAGVCKQAGLAPVMIAAPNSSDAQLDRIAEMGAGYTYCVARAGVTGQRERLALDHDPLFAALRERNAAPPVLGFGISTPDHVRQAASSGAAGVISGSALVAAARSENGVEAVRELAQQLKKGARANAPREGVAEANLV